MKCSRCGATAPHGAAIYCYSCGEPLLERTGEASTGPAGGAQTNELVESDVPVASTPVEHDATVQSAPLPVPVSEEFEFHEYGGTSLPQEGFAGPGSAAPPVSQFPREAISLNPYMQTPGYNPYSVSPVYRSSGRRGPAHPGLWLLLSLALCLLAVLIIFGGIFASFYLLVGRGNVSPSPNSQVSGLASPQPLSKADMKTKGDQVYQQVMSQQPLFGESLRSVAPGGWADYKLATSGCEIRNDGFHVHIDQTDSYFFCYSGHGVFDNFALQVDMKMVSGGGGFVIRSDQDSKNYYYFTISSDGQYFVQIMKDSNGDKMLDQGTSDSLSPGYGVKNTLTVIAQGHQLFFYVNGVFLSGVEDSTYSSGFLGLVASEASTKADVAYTNAKIWEL